MARGIGGWLQGLGIAESGEENPERDKERFFHAMRMLTWFGGDLFQRKSACKIAEFLCNILLDYS
jgi:hypothetical protein